MKYILKGLWIYCLFSAFLIANLFIFLWGFNPKKCVTYKKVVEFSNDDYGEANPIPALAGLAMFMLVTVIIANLR